MLGHRSKCRSLGQIEEMSFEHSGGCIFNLIMLKLNQINFLDDILAKLDYRLCPVKLKKNLVITLETASYFVRILSR